MPRIIGLTGNIACGKTAVGHMLLELGAECYIDADAVVHKLYLSGQPIAVKVAETFGPAVVAADGSVDRKALGVIVFQDTEEMRRLEAIVHPAVSTAIANELASISASGIAIIDAVKLLEGDSGAFCQSKWLVICPGGAGVRSFADRAINSVKRRHGRVFERSLPLPINWRLLMRLLIMVGL